MYLDLGLANASKVRIFPCSLFKTIVWDVCFKLQTITKNQYYLVLLIHKLQVIALAPQMFILSYLPDWYLSHRLITVHGIIEPWPLARLCLADEFKKVSRFC